MTQEAVQAALSVYRHKLGSGDGSSEIITISDGTFEIPPQALAINQSESDITAYLASRGLSTEVVTNPLNVVLVRTGDRLVLIDSGLGAVDAFGPTAGKLFDRLASAGLDVSQITDLALTHLHPDHAAGAVQAQEKGLLSDSVRMHVSQAELDFWSGDTTGAFSDHPSGAGTGEFMTDCARGFISTFDGKVNAFGDSDTIVAGITAKLTPGHTPGHAAFAIENGGARFMFLGDALNASHFANPGWHFFYDIDHPLAETTRRALLEEIADSGTLISAAHMSFPALGTVSKDGGAYRFNPITWAY
ncbi:MAG: MBL fold metallo-hydrolase [Planctomycetota bacterium]